MAGYQIGGWYGGKQWNGSSFGDPGKFNLGAQAGQDAPVQNAQDQSFINQQRSAPASPPPSMTPSFSDLSSVPLPSTSNSFTQPSFQPPAPQGAVNPLKGPVLSPVSDLRGTNSPTPGQINATTASVNNPMTPKGVGDTQLWNEVTKGAQEAQKKYGIPASLTLAQFMLETGGGQNFVGNNLFGIKGTGTAGSTKALTWEQGPNGPYQTYSNFRTYKNIAESIDDHAKLLAEDPSYQKLQQLVQQGNNNPDQFAEALQGIYATDPAYADKLKSLLREHNLVQYDAIQKRLANENANSG